MLWFEFISLKLFIPLLICACISIRPVILMSNIYLIFLIISPYLSLKKSQKSWRTAYLSCLLIMSTCGLILQGCYQNADIRSFLIANIGYNELLGIVNYNRSSFWNVCHMILPDIAIIVSSSLLLAFSTKFQKEKKPEENLVNVKVQKIIDKQINLSNYSLVQSILTITSLVILCLSGAICASLINVIYFLTFLISCIIYATNHILGRKYSIVLKLVSIIMVLQMISLALYQIGYFQQFVPPNSLEARLMGLYKLFSIIDERIEFNGSIDLDFMLQPMVLMISYLIISNSSNKIKKINSMIEASNANTTRDANQREITSVETFSQRIKSFMFRHAYIIAILSMMVWSIVYHSWIGFVYLVVSNVIFMLPNQRKKMIFISPFISIYACILLLITYMYALSLNDTELPVASDRFNLNQIGLIKYDGYRGIHLIFKSLLMVPFLVSTRQKFDPTPSITDLNVQRSQSKLTKYFFKPLKTLLTFSLMWFIIVVLFIMAVYEYEQMTAFRIANMTFFLLYIMVFQLSINLWKRIMYMFWIVLIFYTKIVLILTYIYQFDGFLELSYYKAIGLQKYKTSELFLRLLSLMMITVLSGTQLYYCHDRFLEYFKRTKTVEKVDLEANSNENWTTKLMDLIEKVLLFIEIHFVKFFYLIVFWTSAKHVQIVNVVIMIILTTGILFKSERMRLLMLKIISFISMIFITGVMLYELSMIFIRSSKSEPKLPQCDASHPFTRQYFVRDFEKWFNITETTLYKKIESFFAIIVSLTIFIGFKLRQELATKKQRGKRIFNHTTIDSTFIVKFFIDHGYEAFGIEIIYLAFFTLMFSRLDIISLLYAPFLIILVFKNHQKLKMFWLFMACVITILVIVQCLIIGFFVMTRSCEETGLQYPLQVAFYSIQSLRDNPSILVYDFILLIVLSCQTGVFYAPDRPNESSNLFTYVGTKGFNTLKDVIMRYIFKFQFWIMLSIVFFIGTSDVMLFSFGYITASFIFLWLGADFYSKPLKTIKKWWTVFLSYNVCVILFRYAIKVFGCFFQNYISMDHCWILKFFDVPCDPNDGARAFCAHLIHENAHISDILLFFLIIIQRRIFTSNYFYSTIYDTYITDLLSARGARIMEEIRVQDITSAIEEENQILDEIKKRMRIITNLATLKNMRDGNIDSHHIAVRNGDYYMFEEDFIQDIESTEDAEYVSKKSVVLFRRESDNETINIESDVMSEKSSEVVGRIIRKSKNFGNKMSRFLWSLSYRLLSRKHTLIIKALNEERKFLKEALSMDMSNEALTNLKNSTQKSRHAYFLKKFDEKFWQKANVKLYETVKLEDITLKDLLCEIFYITLLHTDLLIYLTILINQCYYSNMLSLYLPLSIFCWGTLTFPRPTKTFWILLIAYTQCIILIKCVSQFNIVWWDKHHHAVELLGIDNRDHFAAFDMVVLIALFIHRSVQKAIGTWKTDENEFHHGFYELESKDPNSSDIIKLIQSDQVKIVELPDRNEIIGSTNVLIDDEMESQVVIRHEITKNGQQQEDVVKEVLKDRKELLHASEEFSINRQGKLSIIISQDESMVKLYPIDSANAKKVYTLHKLAVVERDLEDPLNFYSSVILMSIKQYFSLIIGFFKTLVPKYHIPRKSVDVYTFCFLCDFINFFVLLFGFSTFAIQSTDDPRSILNYFEENKVPTSLLALIIMQFIVIMIDRMLYLRKNMLGKIIFHYVMIIIIHSWMFFILPVKTNRKFNATSPPIIFYIIKFIYFLLSAYQIRCGYPARVLGNFLMRQYKIIYLIGFKIFMLIPFLFELRTLIDWTFTPTSLSFPEWIRVETIYAQVFSIKCQRVFSEAPKRGIKKTWTVKILLGGGLILLIIVIIWFPLLLFAYSPSIGQSGIPKNVLFTVKIENSEPIYKLDARTEQFVRFDKAAWNKVNQLYEKYTTPHTFLEDFDESDVFLLQMSVNASINWNISPPNLRKLIENLNTNRTVTITTTYEINELGYLRDKEAMKNYEYRISSSRERRLLISILEGNSSEFLPIPKLLPKFLHIRSTGKLTEANKLYTETFSSHQNLRSLLIYMNRDANSQNWWRIQEDCHDNYHEFLLNHFPYHDCNNYLNIFIFTEKLFPSQISNWAAKGILGFYITVVVFCARILRTNLINSGTVTIIVEELPSVDKILNLCNNIYMVREAKQFSLEEDLVAKLLFLYRSPETLIKWTKYKQS